MGRISLGEGITQGKTWFPVYFILESVQVQFRGEKYFLYICNFKVTVDVWCVFIFQEILVTVILVPMIIDEHILLN